VTAAYRQLRETEAARAASDNLSAALRLDCDARWVAAVAVYRWTVDAYLDEQRRPGTSATAQGGRRCADVARSDY
jgi:hypothetical protein